jgi:hypothetical protein
VLTQKYPEKKQEWNLVVKKGFGYLRGKLGISNSEISNLITQLSIL